VASVLKKKQKAAVDQLNETSQDKLFRHCRSERHCLHLFTVKSMPPGAMHSRQCGHDYVLPNIKFDLHKRHFIACSLFIMSKFYVFVSCVRVCIVVLAAFLCKHVRLSCVFCNELTYLQIANTENEISKIMLETEQAPAAQGG